MLILEIIQTLLLILIASILTVRRIQSKGGVPTTSRDIVAGGRRLCVLKDGRLHTYVEEGDSRHKAAIEAGLEVIPG